MRAPIDTDVATNDNGRPFATRVRGRRRTAALIAGALVVAGAGGYAYAAIPNSTNGLITACAVKTGASAGALRVIDAQNGATCKATEKTLNWDSKSTKHPIGSNMTAAAITIAAGDNFIMATPAFVASANANCIVTSSLQVVAVGTTTLGTTLGYFRNAVSKNSTKTDDGVYGHYLVGTGASGYLADITRSSVIPISAGQTIQFGGFLGSVDPGSPIVGSSASVQTAYSCV